MTEFSEEYLKEFPAFERERTCAVTGHRDLSLGIDVNLAENVLRSAVACGYDTFMVGMALGFDFLCFKILEKIRREKPIKIIACVPCRGQANKFSEPQKDEYLRMLSASDETVVLSEEYTKFCMQKRNIYMVDNSSLVIAYLKKNKGGTFNTVKYAESKGVTVIKV